MKEENEKTNKDYRNSESNSEICNDDKIAEFDSDIAALLTSSADEDELRKSLEKFEKENT